VTLSEVQRRSYERAGRALLASWPVQRAMDDAQLAAYLVRKSYCVLATVAPSGAPQARPVAFTLVDGEVWFATVAGARLRNVRAEPRVSVVIAEGERGEHAMVLVEGRVEIHEDAETRERLGEAWRVRHGSAPDWAAAFLELVPERVFSYRARA
jgi:general stress protein 26